MQIYNFYFKPPNIPIKLLTKFIQRLKCVGFLWSLIVIFVGKGGFEPPCRLVLATIQPLPLNHSIGLHSDS